MIPFRYLRPKSLAEAQRLWLTHPGARFLSGGTDLLVQIRGGKAAPTHLIDLKGVAGLSSILLLQDRLHIGALASIQEVCDAPIVRARLPLLAEACGQLGGLQTRNKATLGGNLCHASPSAETAGPLLALGAVVHLSGTEGERSLPLEDFFTGPGSTALRPGEILREVTVPLPAEGSGSAYLKLGRRRAMEIAVVNVAVLLQRKEGICHTARIALGAVFPVPLRARAAEALLEGAAWRKPLLEEAAQAAAAACRPISDVRATEGYRREMVRVLVGRALQRAWEISGG